MCNTHVLNKIYGPRRNRVSPSTLKKNIFESIIIPLKTEHERSKRKQLSKYTNFCEPITITYKEKCIYNSCRLPHTQVMHAVSHICAWLIGAYVNPS